MAEPICEDEGLLQEWTPLTQLLQQVPLKTQRGLFSQNLNLTCVDVVSEFIALGTNLGFVYWYCRRTGDLQRLRFENCHCSVTCTKIMKFNDYMVAVGTDQGTVIVFQIPKIEPGSTLDQIKSKQKQIERFTVNGLHQASVTSIEWDAKELKVFSGDKIGCVVLTEINLNLHISKSMELLNEQFEIVQLSYAENILLISTVFRCIMCDGLNNWKVCQVGTKERKILGKFGATWCKFQHGLVLYASRPGHRLWLSDKNGIVQQTLIFKSAIQSNCLKIQLINPIDKKQPYDTSFGKVVQFGDNKLLTYNSEILYVLHPGAVSVVSVLNSARKILDLAVNENEIFILEGERSLLRISPLPDKYSLDLLYQPVSRRTSFNLDEFAARIKDTAVESIKKITKDLMLNNEQSSPNSPPALAYEALELPPIVNLPPGLMPTILTDENIEIHSSVPDEQYLTSTDDFSNSCPVNSGKPPHDTKNDLNNLIFSNDWQEEIIIRPLPKRRNKRPKPNPQCNLVSESESDTTSNISEDRLVCGVANDLSLSDESAFSQSQSSFSVLRDISSLLDPQKATGNEESVKTLDTKSQTSLDTCESVSERLVLTSEAFREEQEKTFARLASQPLFGSYNSEKTDNMSISFNMTISSSFSSKISENSPSRSFTSENSGAAFNTKSAESQNPNNVRTETQAKNHWKWSNDFTEENFNQEEGASECLVSYRNSQHERVYENEAESSAIDRIAENYSVNLTVNKSLVYETLDDNNSECGISETVLNDASSSAERKTSNSTQESNTDSKPDFPECRDQMNLKNFSQSENLGLEEAEHKVKENVEEAKTNEFEPLSYGPPSGSSLLGSQPPSDFYSTNNTVLIAPQISQPLVRDSSDHWPQYKAPEKITSLAVCKNYVVCTDAKDRIYYSQLSGLGLVWILLNYKASMVSVANDGSVVWLLKKNSVSALVNPSPNSPLSDSVVEIAEDIRTFAIDRINNDKLLVNLMGKIIKYSEGKSNPEEKEIACDYVVASIACSGGVIVALSNDYTVLCKLPEEEHFKVVKTLKPVTYITLGPKNLLWVVDDVNDIFFSDDFQSEEPHWWQIQISDYIYRNSLGSYQNLCSKIKLNELRANMQMKTSVVATNDNSVWIFNKFDSCVWVNKTGFTGYMWNKLSAPKFLLKNIKWRALCAAGIFQDKGRLWLLSLDGNIFCTIPNNQIFQSLPVPCDQNILCMSSSVDTLWVLSEGGKIHSRLGLSSSDGSGTSWKEIKSPQIDNLRFIWVSCGWDVAWACDIHGRTFITIGSPHHMSSLDPIWVEVEGRPKDVQFEKVFVGSQLYMVWAIDTNHNLYVREGIFPHYQIGTSWVYVCGIEAIHVTVSGGYVWALASNGNIYRRCGVSESNYVGDYWRSIPGNFQMISSSFTDELWGINHENKILRLSFNLKILQERTNSENKEIPPLKEDVSWEIIK